MSGDGASADTSTLAWLGFVLLGAYHGINPAMGWLFAVALGMQEKSGRAVGRSLLPIALGHGLSIGLVVLAATLAQAVLPLRSMRVGVALILGGLGTYYLIRRRHPRWVGMRVGFRDLTAWSFLMASAHGAGFMLVPLLLVAAPEAVAESGVHLHQSAQPEALTSPFQALAATLAHTAAYLAVAGSIAWVVYAKVGLGLLRTAWINLDLVWASALIVTALFTVLM